MTPTFQQSVDSVAQQHSASFQRVQEAIRTQSEDIAAAEITGYLNDSENERNSEEYLAVLNTYVEQYGTNSPAYEAFARVYWEQKDYDKSLNYYEKSVKLDPDNINALLGAASLLVWKGQPVEAIYRCHRALDHNPQEFRANYLCGVAHLKLARRYGKASARIQCQAACKMLQIAEASNEDDREFPYWMGYCLNRLGRYSEALPYLRMMLLRTREFNCELWCEIGTAMKRTGKIGRMLNLLYFMHKNGARFEQDLIEPHEYLQFV